MINDVKILMIILGVAIMSAIVRFTTFISFIKDSILGFLMGVIIYYCLDYFQFSESVKSGIVGATVLNARPLYDFLNTLISTKLLEWFDNYIKRKHDN